MGTKIMVDDPDGYRSLAIWLAFDMDEKGREAVEQTFRVYQGSFKVHDVKFPRPRTLDGKRRVKDPSELWETWGDKRFGAYLRGFDTMEIRNA